MFNYFKIKNGTSIVLNNVKTTMKEISGCSKMIESSVAEEKMKKLNDWRLLKYFVHVWNYAIITTY